MDRISADDYKPTSHDMLCTRTKTTGVVEKLIKVNEGLSIRLVDVGGQRNERRKWFSLFEGVTLVIFLCAVSDYNKLLYEGNVLQLLLLSSSWFINSPLIL